MRAPQVEVEMSRDLDVMRNSTDYILREDIQWGKQHRFACGVRKKLLVLASNRTLSQAQRRIALDEVKGFPVVFQVRENSKYGCGREFRFGIFNPNIPDSPAWPEEAPLLHWQEPTNMACCVFPKVGVMTNVGQQIGFIQAGNCANTISSVLDTSGNLLYTLRQPCCASSPKMVIYEEKGRKPVGFIMKVWPMCCDESCACLSENQTAASFPATSNLTNRLLLLKEMVTQGRRFQMEVEANIAMHGWIYY